MLPGRDGWRNLRRRDQMPHDAGPRWLPAGRQAAGGLRRPGSVQPVRHRLSRLALLFLQPPVSSAASHRLARRKLSARDRRCGGGLRRAARRLHEAAGGTERRASAARDASSDNRQARSNPDGRNPFHSRQLKPTTTTKPEPCPRKLIPKSSKPSTPSTPSRRTSWWTSRANSAAPATTSTHSKARSPPSPRILARASRRRKSAATRWWTK